MAAQAKNLLDSKQSIDVDNEIVESSLYTIESLTRKAPKDIDPFLDSILELSANLVLFDPNYTYDESGGDVQMDEDEGEGWGSDFEDDNLANEDDDDTSWKVRRASVKLIDAIVNSRPEMLRRVYQQYGRLLVSRFKERDDNVKCNILETFRTLLKAAILTE